MKIMIRAHDLGVKGEESIVRELDRLGLDGVQLVVYKATSDVKYARGSLTSERAAKIGGAFASHSVALVGAYFNPVHPNAEKAALGEDIFREYIDLSHSLGCNAVGSETGSFMGDPWGYHPQNGSPEALDRVVEVFTRLADYAARVGVNIGIEGAFNHVCRTPDRLHECITRIGRDNVRVILDLYNYLDISNYENAYSILERALSLHGDRVLLYHVKDFTVEGGALRQCGVGRGVLDLSRVIGRIHENDPNAILVLEGTVGEDIPFAIEHLGKIISGL